MTRQEIEKKRDEMFDAVIEAKKNLQIVTLQLKMFQAQCNHRDGFHEYWDDNGVPVVWCEVCGWKV